MCTAKEVDNLKHALRSREAQRQPPNVDEDGDDAEGDEISEENTREINETGQASFAERKGRLVSNIEGALQRPAIFLVLTHTVSLRTMQRPTSTLPQAERPMEDCVLRVRRGEVAVLMEFGPTP